MFKFNRFGLFGLLFWLMAMATACEETVRLDIAQSQPRYVIDALLTDENKVQRVRVTRSVDFYERGSVPGVNNATVSITDDKGRISRFVHSSAGIYLSEQPFAGEVGTTYTLRVQVAGQEFAATDQMQPIIPIDKLESRVNERRKANPREGQEGRYYEVLAFAKEPPQRRDYYLFKFFRNGEVQNDQGRRLTYTDDEYIAENIDGLPFPDFYALGDTAAIEMYSISRPLFVYYDHLSGVLNNDGGMFSAIPSNPYTNIRGGAMGVFQVSALTRASIVVK